MSKIAHINCDMGESYGNFVIGNDTDILPYVDAINIACGFHGGDPLTILQTIDNAKNYSIEIGAHPSYPDLIGFGRRKMDMTDEELYAALLYQIIAIKGLCEIKGATLSHVKPHGALYNVAANEEKTAKVIINAVLAIGKELHLYVPPNSIILEMANHYNIKTKIEVFADRKYDRDGGLLSRRNPEALISNPILIKNQFVQLMNNQVQISEEETISLFSDTVCIHGDNPGALEALKLIRQKNER